MLPSFEVSDYSKSGFCQACLISRKLLLSYTLIAALIRIGKVNGVTNGELSEIATDLRKASKLYQLRGVGASEWPK
jgi:hypothetical protein